MTDDSKHLSSVMTSVMVKVLVRATNMTDDRNDRYFSKLFVYHIQYLEPLRVCAFSTETLKTLLSSVICHGKSRNPHPP